MKISADILNELREISPILAGIERVNVFTVPKGYFEGLPATVILTVKKEEDAGILNDLAKQEPFDIPDGYFETLADNILHKIKTTQSVTATDELKNLSPLLHSIQKENVFKVPGGYFDGLANSIVSMVKSTPAKVVVMQGRKLFLKFAAAAMMTGIIALAMYTFIEKTSHSTINIPHTATLESFIEKGKNMNESQFNETLNNLSVEDIASYLEKNTDETDVALLTSAIEENSLPSPEDYLLDEKALEHYLEEIDLKKLNN